MKLSIKPSILQGSIVVLAAVASLGSLYYSTFGEPVVNMVDGNFFPVGMGIAPCDLCWYTRILMYPIVLIGLLSLIKKDKQGIDYSLILIVPGFFLSLYHVMAVQLSLGQHVACTDFNPCATGGVHYFGFLSMPMLSLVVFAMMLGLGIWGKVLSKE